MWALVLGPSRGGLRRDPFWGSSRDVLGEPSWRPGAWRWNAREPSWCGSPQHARGEAAFIMLMALQVSWQPLGVAALVVLRVTQRFDALGSSSPCGLRGSRRSVTAIVVLSVRGRHGALGRRGIKVLGARRSSHVRDLQTHGCSCSPCGLSAVAVLVARLCEALVECPVECEDALVAWQPWSC